MSYTIDASVFVAAARPAEAGHAASLELLEQVAHQGIPTTCPTLLLVECAAAIARATDDQALAEQSLDLIEVFPGLSLVPLSRDLMHRAAEIAIQHRLRGADAVYVAVAERVGDTLVSWDREMLERGRAVIPTATPDDILPALHTS
jgi:predicted nucleic acid-binding protein